MLIIHGDNTTSSREKLIQVINSAKEKKQEVTRLEAKKITLATLEETLSAHDLFGTSKLIIIEELHSLPTSKKKKELLKLLIKPQAHSLVLWEKRSLTKTMLKKLNNPEALEYKTSKDLFKWLELLGTPNNQDRKLKTLHQAIQKDGEHFCFLMLTRQIRLLITTKSGGVVKGPPFVVKKLHHQAQYFTLTKLLKLHKTLLKIDVQSKTSTNLLPLTTRLDLLTLTM